MAGLDLAQKLFEFGERLFSYRARLREEEAERRRRLASYCRKIAEALRDLARALGESGPNADAGGLAEVYGRITGYLEDVPEVMAGSLDGRKVAGLRKRLESLVGDGPVRQALDGMSADARHKILEAAGAFTATADALEV